MGNKIFARGYSASREEKERQDKNRENSGKKLFRFFIKNNGEEADLRFLTEEPVNFNEHTVQVGAGKFENYTCTGKDCPFCDDGNKATFKGAYLVVDRREFEYTDKEGKKKKGKDQVRLFVQGMRVVSQLDRISEKYGLSNRDVTMVRLGTGTATTYTIERGDESKITRKEVESYLPDKLRDDYDGTMDSLMSIIEEQLMMATRGYTESSDEESSDDSAIIGYDTAEEEKPKTKLRFKSSQNSVKPRTKNLWVD